MLSSFPQIRIFLWSTGRSMRRGRMLENSPGRKAGSVFCPRPRRLSFLTTDGFESCSEKWTSRNRWVVNRLPSTVPLFLTSWSFNFPSHRDGVTVSFNPTKRDLYLPPHITLFAFGKWKMNYWKMTSKWGDAVEMRMRNPLWVTKPYGNFWLDDSLPALTHADFNFNWNIPIPKL